MARPKLVVDEQEVDEIINIKLEELGGVKSKLTYNNVWMLNKRIANNTEHLRENGAQYSLYGYQFWAASYKGNDYYGKRRIDEIKSEETFILAGKQFTPQMQDIFVLFDKYGGTSKSVSILKEKMLQLFEKDRTKIGYLEEELKVTEKKLENANRSLEKFQDNFIKMFFDSQEENNSLQNVMQLKKSGDVMLDQQLKEMFGDKLVKVVEEIDEAKIDPNKVISQRKVQVRRKKLEEEGF